MLTIPLQAGQNQEVVVLLENQLCHITVRENSTGVYLDLSINGAPIRMGVLCLDKNPMITELYLGFVGQLMFDDILGNSDPTASGFGARYMLRYLQPGIDY